MTLLGVQWLSYDKPYTYYPVSMRQKLDTPAMYRFVLNPRFPIVRFQNSTDISATSLDQGCQHLTRFKFSVVVEGFNKPMETAWIVSERVRIGFNQHTFRWVP